MKVLPFIVLCSIGCSSAVIYHLNDTQYELMPKLLRIDPYEKCLRDPGGLYCTVDFALVSDEPSPLLTMIQEYSDHSPKHFNHSLLTHGVCINSRCQDFYLDTSKDLKDRLEACLNKTYWEEYRLKTKAMGQISCTNGEKKMDYQDMIVAVVLLILVMLNVAGTFYDVAFTTGKPDDGIKFLISFSIRRNFQRLISDPYVNSDSRLRQLKGLNGLRTIMILLVIVAHSLAASSLFADNTHDVEKLFLLPICKLIINGTILMQTFFIMSGLLMVYNSCMYVEKNEYNWKVLPKTLLLRYLRLTPANAVLVAFTATWMRHLGSGPLWNKTVNEEVMDCRKDWWWLLLFVNNYNDTSNCMIQAWYLAADMQCFCVGILIFVCCRNKITRITVLSVMFVLGSIIIGLHTYYQDLNGVLLLSPETARRFFIVDDTFNHIYKRGHTNLSGYIMGMAMGYILYYWKEIGVDLEKYKTKKYRFLYWSTLPLLGITIYSGDIFYGDRPQQTLLIRTMYAVFIKPVFIIIMGALILGVTTQYDNVYRSVLEWDGWTVPSKITFATYLVHVPIIKYIMGVQTTLNTTSILVIVITYCGVAVMSLVAAYIFWLLVEAPFSYLLRGTLKAGQIPKPNNEKTEAKTDHN